MLNSIEDRLQPRGAYLDSAMFQLIRRGYSWQEVAERVDFPLVKSPSDVSTVGSRNLPSPSSHWSCAAL